MSKPQNETTVHDISSMPTDESTAPQAEKKPNVAVRLARKAKTIKPKTAIAVVGGVVLVGAGMALGRKTAPLHLEVVDSNVDPEDLIVIGDYSSETDDSVA